MKQLVRSPSKTLYSTSTFNFLHMVVNVSISFTDNSILTVHSSIKPLSRVEELNLLPINE